MNGVNRLRRSTRPTTRLNRRVPALLVVVGLSITLWSCASTQTTEEQITMEAPRANGGVVFDEPTEVGLERIRVALEQIEEPPVSPSVMSTPDA